MVIPDECEYMVPCGYYPGRQMTVGCDWFWAELVKYALVYYIEYHSNFKPGTLGSQRGTLVVPVPV